MNKDRKKIGEQFLRGTLGAVIGSGQRIFHKVPSYQMADHLSRQPIDLKISKELSVDISLHPIDYNRLIDMLGYFSESKFSNHLALYYVEFQEQLYSEQRLRDHNPALQKAYEKYQILLALANDKGELQ